MTVGADSGAWVAVGVELQADDALEPGLLPVVRDLRPAHLHLARRVLAPLPVGGGTPHYFVQLSRLDALGAVDFASFTTASLVHGADDDEVMLGLASLPDMVATWRARHPALPLRIGPSAIALRSSPLGAQPPSDGTRRLALAAADPRSHAQFGAAWALGHVVGLARAGVESVTLLALRGPQGVVALNGVGAARRPVFDLLAQLGRPARRLAVEVIRPQRVAALALQRCGQAFVLLANLAAEPVEVDVVGLLASDTRLMLGPNGVHRVDAVAG